MSQTYEFDAILFDNDGTITDSTPGVRAAWLSLGADYGFDAEAAIEGTHGMRPIDSLRKYCGVDDHEKLVALVRRFKEAVIEGGPKYLPGAAAMIEQMRKNAPTDRHGWAIVTSATRWYATRTLERIGFGTPDVLIASSDVSKGKPHPEPYIAGATSCSVAPEDFSRVLVVEDAVSGVASGKAAGMKVLAVLHTTPRDALQAMDADWIVPDLSHVSAEWTDGKVYVTIRG
ncbi:HAD-like protein [Exidia glandulosa HHB12029]|uniref:HAD-like protein n=1 Tax=Exidia glandulosa HHB12029 TaxID=1314781 RepID=A0A165M2S3_EXIGL|nr:HAD-like protein [Exidia glandulosa HHB12029]